MFSPIYQTTQRHVPEDRNQEGRRLMISQIHFVIKTTGATLCTLKEVCLTEKKINLPLYLIKHHVMKAYGGEGGDLAPRILNLGCSYS